MAYPRRWNKYKYAVKGYAPHFKSQAIPAAQMAVKALSLATQVAKSINVEKKYSETSFTGSIGGVGAPKIQLLNGIAQGDGGTTRDGDQVKFTDLGVRLWLKNTQAFSDVYRVMIVLDKQADGTAPTIAEVLENAGVLNFNNMDNKMRFSVLKDELFYLSPNGDTGEMKLLKMYLDLTKKYKKSKGLRTRYSDTGAAVTDIASNSLWLIIFNRSGTANGSDVEYKTRIRYVDN